MTTYRIPGLTYSSSQPPTSYCSRKRSNGLLFIQARRNIGCVGRILKDSDAKCLAGILSGIKALKSTVTVVLEAAHVLATLNLHAPTHYEGRTVLFPSMYVRPYSRRAAPLSHQSLIQNWTPAQNPRAMEQPQHNRVYRYRRSNHRRTHSASTRHRARQVARRNIGYQEAVHHLASKSAPPTDCTGTAGNESDSTQYQRAGC